MYPFVGFIDRTGHRQPDLHRQARETLRLKFPQRTAPFETISREGLWLCGTNIESSRIGSAELFMTGELYSADGIARNAHPARPVTEILLERYLAEGDTAFRRLNGSFILILMDHATGHWSIVNDAMGTRQVLYHIGAETVIFGSELKFLFCHPHCSRTIDWAEALTRPIPFIVVNPERRYSAWFKDVALLPEGSILSGNRTGTPGIRPYWDPWSVAAAVDPAAASGWGEKELDECAEACLALLDDAVRIRCGGSGHAYSMFSGGLDSTLIAALARRHGHVGTFSFATQATVCDGATEMAIRLAGDLDLPNTQVVLPFDELASDGQLWQKVIWSAESPFAHKDALGKTLLHAAISAVDPAVRHILSGTGSDQLNGGLVRWFVEDAEPDDDAANWEKVMTELRSEMRKPVISHAHDAFWGSRDLLTTDFLSSLGRGNVNAYPWADFTRGCLQANQFVLVWDELRAGDAHGRGVRFPFMDQRFVPFFLGLPRAMHPRLFFDKQIMRRAARTVLPAYLTDQPKAPVFKPHEDRRVPMYTSILFGNGGRVLDELLDTVTAAGLPVDRDRFVDQARSLAGRVDPAGWSYLMHIAGLVALSRLPECGERDMDVAGDVMDQVSVIDGREPGALSIILNQLDVPPPDDPRSMPVAFGEDCALVADVHTGMHFLVKDGELRYALEDEHPDWRTFLRAVDGLRSVEQICSEEGIDSGSFAGYLHTCLGEGILRTLTIPTDHAHA